MSAVEKIGMPDTCINCGKVHSPGDCESAQPFKPCPDTEAVFCLALLNTLDTRQTQRVLESYLSFVEKWPQTIEALGRRTPNNQAHPTAECEHDWKEIEAQDLSEDYGSVVCKKCGCPGEMTWKTRNVFWPST